MRDGMIRVVTYLNELEAEMALGQLEAMGIAAVIEMDNCGGMRPHLDLSHGVSVLVHKDDETQARELLKGNDTPQGGPWTCPSCGEGCEAGFDACWNCGFERV